MARDLRRNHEPGWAVLQTCERGDEVENLTRVDVAVRAAASGRESSKTPEGRHAGDAWSVRGPHKDGVDEAHGRRRALRRFPRLTGRNTLERPQTQESSGPGYG